MTSALAGMDDTHCMTFAWQYSCLLQLHAGLDRDAGVGKTGLYPQEAWGCSRQAWAWPTYYEI